jgi:endonuclease-3 related protein
VKNSRTAETVTQDPERTIRAIYRKLARAWGPQYWWPAQTPFEVVVGAILTQNTSWTNVELALINLRRAGVLSLEGFRNLPLAELEILVRPSGYFRQKAQRLKSFVSFVDGHHAGSLERMFALPVDDLRRQLLERKGIGRETADSILLYAAQKPVFVVDACAQRIFERHGVIHSTAHYDEVRLLAQRALAGEVAPVFEPPVSQEPPPRPPAHAPSAMSMAQQSVSARVYNEMHGLIVQAGKHYCFKQRPDCENCPLGEMLTPPKREALQHTLASLRKTRSRPPGGVRPGKAGL